MTAQIIQMTAHQDATDYSGIPEVHVLYGIIDNTSPEDVKKSAETAIDCHKKSDERPVRPIALKNAFKQALTQYATNSGKPVDDACVGKINEFFRLAVCSGIKTADDLANKVGENSSAQIMRDMAHLAKAQRQMNIERRTVGRALRELSKV